MIYALDGVSPDLHEGAWIAPDATLIGKVVLERFASGRVIPTADRPAAAKKTVMPPPDYESV